MSFIDWLQTAGIVISLAITFVQIRMYIKTLRMSIVTTISERNDTLLQDVANNSKVIRGFIRPFDPKARNLFADPRAALMYRTLNFFDEMLFYYQQGYINKGTWELYQYTICNFFTEKFTHSFWNHVRKEYSDELQKVVDNALVKTKPNKQKKQRTKRS